MKKILLLFVASTLLSCGASKMINQTEKSFSGEWTLTEVTYPNSSGFFDVTLFQTADAKCFESSVWKFVANNNRGTVELYDPYCTTATQNIVWSVAESATIGYANDILLKMAESDKARKENQGSRLQINDISENIMVWDLNVQYQSKPVIVRLNFVKN